MSSDWLKIKRIHAEKLLSIIVKRQILKKGNFALHLGHSTEYYLDFRLVPSHPNDFIDVCTAYADLIKNEISEFDALTGVAYSAIPFAAGTSVRLNVPYILMEKIEKEGSLRTPVYGHIKKGDRIVILDDVSASGVTLLCVASVLRALGGVVKDVVVLVDREQGADKVLSEQGINLHYYLKLSEILSYVSSR
ncbi:MAG: phosphoribosyltransferase family protein [Nitrososphaerota archaeon]|nr:phosphoribosyltransferase family protein [Nitrososphaerota archaeon]